MPRNTRAGRGAVALGIVGLAFLTIGITATPILQLASPRRPRTDVAAARHRLDLLAQANHTGNVGAANAIAGSIAAGIGVDTPSEIAADLQNLCSANGQPERDLVIAHATGMLDVLDRSPELQAPWLDTLARCATIAGTLAAAIAIATLQRIVRRQHAAEVVRHMIDLLPGEPSRHHPATAPDPSPDFGRIIAVTPVNDP